MYPVYSAVVQAFGEITRKFLISQELQRANPHVLLQTITDASNKRFQIGTVSDPIDVLIWFLNTSPWPWWKQEEAVVLLREYSKVSCSRYLNTKSTKKEAKEGQKPKIVSRKIVFIPWSVSAWYTTISGGDTDLFNLFHRVPMIDFRKFDGQTEDSYQKASGPNFLDPLAPYLHFRKGFVKISSTLRRTRLLWISHQNLWFAHFHFCRRCLQQRWSSQRTPSRNWDQSWEEKLSVQRLFREVRPYRSNLKGTAISTSILWPSIWSSLPTVSRKWFANRNR